ncbi:MAG TPA: acyltransferase family protein [Streptosporangiaceae bacterium]|nr:acyltransferase family protein [Streptosporangiaceae bacterium]
MPKPVSSDQRYMPGLDGLRALAVLAVIAYHEQFGWAPGGLLGVGVFFTLSGFLITSLLVGQWSKHGRIRLGDFWLKRARRLLPALFVMLAVVTAWVTIADRARLASLRGAVGAAAGYFSNWYLIAKNQSYFARFAPPQPLDHLWSLAVEEQFYLVWPLLLMAGLFFVRKRGTAAVRWLAVPTLVLAMASVLAMLHLYQPGTDPTRVYEGTDTRAFGLLIGAALALLWPTIGTRGVRALRAVTSQDADASAAQGAQDAQDAQNAQDAQDAQDSPVRAGSPQARSSLQPGEPYLTEGFARPGSPKQASGPMSTADWARNSSAQSAFRPPVRAVSGPSDGGNVSGRSDGGGSARGRSTSRSGAGGLGSSGLGTSSRSAGGLSTRGAHGRPGAGGGRPGTRRTGGRGGRGSAGNRGRTGRRGARGLLRRSLLDLAGFAGLAGIGVMIWKVGEYSPFAYRGGLVLLSLATAAVVAAAVYPGTLVGLALGWAPLRWIGARSYGIYLWHYPVIVLTSPANSREDLPRVAWQIAAAIVLAALSWRFVEEPIRHGAIGRLAKRVRGADLSTRNLGRVRPAGLAATTATAGVLVVAAAGLTGAVHTPARSQGSVFSAGSLQLPVTKTVVKGPARGAAGQADAGKGARARAGAAASPSAAPGTPGGGPLRTSCRAVAHIGDSTSDGLVSADYLPKASDRIVARYEDVGVETVITDISGARSIVEALPGQINGYYAAKGIVRSGFRGCWVIALGTNDTADVAVGSTYSLRYRINRMMSVADGEPVMWVNVKSLLVSGPYAEANMLRWDRTLVQECAKYPNMRVFNWAAIVKRKWFISDGIHYTSLGYRHRAKDIADALAHAFPQTGHSSGCVVTS